MSILLKLKDSLKVIQKIRLFYEVQGKCVKFMGAFRVHPRPWRSGLCVSIECKGTEWILVFHMNVGQFLGFCFCLFLGACLPEIALRLIILVETQDKRLRVCLSPCWGYVRTGSVLSLLKFICTLVWCSAALGHQVRTEFIFSASIVSWLSKYEVSHINMGLHMQYFALDAVDNK